jgi:cytochrome c
MEKLPHANSQAISGKFVRILPLAALCALTMAIPGQARDRATFLDRGRAIATQNCAGCHAIGRKGTSPNRNSPTFRSLGARFNIDDLDEAFVEGLTSNHKGMPDFQFSASDTMAMLAYIKSVQPKAKRH